MTKLTMTLVALTVTRVDKFNLKLQPLLGGWTINRPRLGTIKY